MTTATVTRDLTTAEVRAFIFACDSAALADLQRQIKARHKALRAQAAASVSVGATVTLEGLSPKYLNGLTGTVTSIDRARGSVTLDEASTQRLRFDGARRFFIAADATEYLLGGVPLGCMRVA